MASQLPRRAANLAMMAVLLPFRTSLLVRTYARLVHNFTGNIIGMSQIMLPFLVLPLYASMKVIDGDYLKAAANLGASPTAAFWRVFFPLPLMVPIIMIAVGVFFLYAKLGMINTIIGLVFAHTMLAIPLVVIVVTAGLKSYDMNQELVARSLGASRARAFITITLPQIRFSVITGALLAFLTSLDEVIIALFISGGPNATITRRMFNALRDQIDPTIASISTCLIVVSVLLLATAQVFGKESD